MKSKFYTLRYAIIQGSYWAAYCIFYSYAAIFMEDKGFSSSQIGLIFALGNIFAVIMQPLVASMIDKSKRISLRISICSLLAVSIAASVGMMFLQSVKWLVPILFIVIYMMLQTVQPLASSLALECENYGNQINFGLARGCGSFGFSVSSILIGMYLAHHSIRTIPIFYILIFIIGFIAVYTFVYKDKREQSVRLQDTDLIAHNGIVSFIRCYPKFCLMLIGVILLFFNHTMINNFTIYIVQNIGGSSAEMGTALAVAAFSEVPAMALFSKIRKHFSVRSLLIFACVMFSVKHIILLLTTNMIILILVHAMQMVSYAIFLPASIYYVDHIMQKGDAVKGQAYVTMAITISSIFGSLFGGVLIDRFGVFYMMLIGTIVSAVGGGIVISSTEKVK